MKIVQLIGNEKTSYTVYSGSTFPQRFIRCAMRFGIGFCQQQFMAFRGDDVNVTQVRESIDHLIAGSILLRDDGVTIDAIWGNCGTKCGVLLKRNDKGDIVFQHFRITMDIPVDALNICETGKMNDGTDICRQHRMTRHVTVAISDIDKIRRFEPTIKENLYDFDEEHPVSIVVGLCGPQQTPFEKLFNDVKVGVPINEEKSDNSYIKINTAKSPIASTSGLSNKRSDDPKLDQKATKSRKKNDGTSDFFNDIIIAPDATDYLTRSKYSSKFAHKDYRNMEGSRRGFPKREKVAKQEMEPKKAKIPNADIEGDVNLLVTVDAKEKLISVEKQAPEETAENAPTDQQS